MFFLASLPIQKCGPFWAQPACRQTPWPHKDGLLEAANFHEASGLLQTGKEKKHFLGGSYLKKWRFSFWLPFNPSKKGAPLWGHPSFAGFFPVCLAERGTLGVCFGVAWQLAQAEEKRHESCTSAAGHCGLLPVVKTEQTWARGLLDRIPETTRVEGNPERKRPLVSHHQTLATTLSSD